MAVQAAKTMEDFWTEMGWYEERYDRIAGKRIRRLKSARWQDERVKKAAVRFLVKDVLRKDPRDVTKEDFHGNRLGGLLFKYYDNSPYKALRETGYEIEPWEMLETPHGFYKTPENRIATVRWFVERLGKCPQDVTAGDFHRKRLGGLLCNYYHDSPYEALLDAGLVTKEDKGYMRSPLHGRKILEINL